MVWGVSRRSPIGVGDDGFVGAEQLGPDQVRNGVGSERRGTVRAGLLPAGLDFSASLEMTFGGGPDAVGQEVVGEKLPWHVELGRGM